MFRKALIFVPFLIGGGLGIGLSSSKSSPSESAIQKTIDKPENKDKSLLVASVDIGNLEQSSEIYDDLKKLKPQYVGFESDLKGEQICRNFGYIYPETNWSNSTGWRSMLLGTEPKHQAWRCIYKELPYHQWV